MKIISLALCLTLAHAITEAATSLPFVHRSVHRQLEQQNTVDIVVTMRKSPREAFESLDAMQFPTRSAKISHIVASLETLAITSQRGIDQILSQESASAQPLYESAHLSWSTNSRYIKGASFELVMALAAVPEIQEIREEEVVYLDGGFEEAADADNSTAPVAPEPVQWGVKHIGANKVWQDKVTGEGIVVGSIDSGARATHELLRDSFRSEYGWYAPFNKTSVPYDVVGHGTHTIGTMAGAGGIGVAPGAKWISCMACPFACPESGLVQCGEWMLCPTDKQGNNKDCSKAPHVINCSWQMKKSEVYTPIVNAWREAGIIPVFAQGNSGPNCGTVVSPGDFPNVIGVGNIAVNGSLSRTSSRGPLASGVLKPDLTAPGVEVISAAHKNNTGLAVKSGTSMAAPHVAGAIALLLSAQPELTYDQVYALLTSTTDQENINKYTTNCDNTTELNWPNGNYGYGILNVFNAYSGARPTPLPTPTEEPSSVPTTELPTEMPSAVPATEEPTESPTSAPVTEQPTETQVPSTEAYIVF